MRSFNEIAAMQLGISPESINDELTPKDIPGWDSMNYLLFIAELEKEYGVSFTMDEVLSADSLGAVRRALAAKGASV